MSHEPAQTAARRRTIRRWATALVATAVLVAAVLSVRVVRIEDLEPAETFDPAAFAAENYATEIVPQIEAEAVDLATLLAALADGTDPSEFGNTPGAGSAYAFPVTLTAVAGKATPPALPLIVEGVPSNVVVQLQIGPALNGTAIRDVTGTITFNQFVNQLEYQNVGTELNNLVRESVLAQLDVASLEGKTLLITGAFLRVNPEFVSIVPVKIEVVP